MRRLVSCLLFAALIAAAPIAAEKNKKKKDSTDAEEVPFRSSTFNGLSLRTIGPAITSGRIGDIAIDPRAPATWYVAVASGGVWKTANAGTTWTPLFDDQPSYSIGCVAVDPGDPGTVWVGTGENNSQRSVSYGDGVYRSRDGGKSWTAMGLADSEHIGKILIDPRDSNVVWVAAQGPLWRAGGDRGVYKTVDGGATWEQVLAISEHTGASDLAFDPRDPDVVYATAYQRRRHVWTLIDGGPESAVHRTTDGGKTWTRLDKGLPGVDLGRIGIAVSPADPDVVYAIVEAERDEGGFFRSMNRGESWEKRSKYVSGSPQYYQEIVADPRNVDRVYSLDTWLQVTEDGGKNFSRVGNRSRHVDDHALWIDPADTAHLVVGGDGGLYESRDRGANWQFKANLPVTQFYRIQPDNDVPFYNVYGGTQDNFTLGGPSRTTSRNGITNREWFVTLGGDGFEPQIDPVNPDIVYSQYQHGGLARYDRRSGEAIDIQPQSGPDEAPLRWNWDSPLIVSPHSATRLYFAAQRVFRSDDRGDSWQPESGDLSRGIDRNALEVMGRVQKVDAVAKNASTSFYGNVVALGESPLEPGLLYAGTDDGLVHVREGDGAQWRRVESFPGVPDTTYVSDLEPSWHDAGTVFAAFNNHKNGDFRPYLLRSDDRGRGWVSIAGDLPERGSVYTLVQDHEDPNLLFVGTEFGLYFTLDGGTRWLRLAGGLPTIAVRDLEIQRRENDLVVGTFGRGIWILDDYTPLRAAGPHALATSALLFPVKPAWIFVPSMPLGIRDKGFQGDDFYTAPNPPAGAVFTYYLKDAIRTREQQRHEREKKAEKAGDPYTYPTWDALRAEDHEEDPSIVLTVRDAAGNVVRRLTGPVGAGIHRVAWDLRYPTAEPTRLEPWPDWNPFSDPPTGPLVLPGSYTVTLSSRVEGVFTDLVPPQPFEAVSLGLGTLAAEDKAALLDFQQKTARLQRAVLGAIRSLNEAGGRLDHLEHAADETPGASPGLADRIRALRARFADVRVPLVGDRTVASRNEPTPPSIEDRVSRIVGGQWSSTSPPTETNRQAYRIAGALFAPVLDDLRGLIEVELRGVEEQLEAAGGPWTPGRVPRWAPETGD